MGIGFKSLLKSKLITRFVTVGFVVLFSSLDFSFAERVRTCSQVTSTLARNHHPENGEIPVVGNGDPLGYLYAVIGATRRDPNYRRVSSPERILAFIKVLHVEYRLFQNQIRRSSELSHLVDALNRVNWSNRKSVKRALFLKGNTEEFTSDDVQILVKIQDLRQRLAKNLEDLQALESSFEATSSSSKPSIRQKMGSLNDEIGSLIKEIPLSRSFLTREFIRRLDPGLRDQRDQMISDLALSNLGLIPKFVKEYFGKRWGAQSEESRILAVDAALEAYAITLSTYDVRTGFKFSSLLHSAIFRRMRRVLGQLRQEEARFSVASIYDDLRSENGQRPERAVDILATRDHGEERRAAWEVKDIWELNRDILTDRERRVIEMRFGLMSGREMSISEISRALRHTEKTVRKMIDVGLRKLRVGAESIHH